MDKCIGNMVLSMRRYNVVTHVKSCFLSMFSWEQFTSLAPKSMEYLEDRQRRAFYFRCYHVKGHPEGQLFRELTEEINMVAREACPPKT